MKIHAGNVELAVANLIGYRKHVIVPNVSYGLAGMGHECDLLVLDDKNRFTEVEIKISMADLKADFKKKHGHKSKYISRLIYAFPEEMLDKALPLIPENNGIIVVKTISPLDYSGHTTQIQYHKAYWIRHARHDKTKERIPDKILRDFFRLGCMRIWSLKSHNNRQYRK